jgi:hypothetical protein
MFTKSALALAIILGITSGSLAATTHRQHSTHSASSAYAAVTPKYDNHGSKTFKDPMRSDESWDPYGMRWD